MGEGHWTEGLPLGWTVEFFIEYLNQCLLCYARHMDSTLNDYTESNGFINLVAFFLIKLLNIFFFLFFSF